MDLYACPKKLFFKNYYEFRLMGVFIGIGIGALAMKLLLLN